MINYGNDPREDEIEEIDRWFINLLGYQKKPIQYKGHKKTIRASESGVCPRLNTFRAYNKGVVSEVTAASVAYMEIGNAIENMLIDSLVRNNKLIARGFKLPKNDINVVGIVDAIFLDHKDQVAILEIKTCGQLPEEPVYTHLRQAQIYSAFTGIDKVYLTYISRNVKNNFYEDLSIKTFLVPTGKTELITVLYFAAQSYYAIENKSIVPKPNSFRKTIECKHCDFIKFCWDNEEEDYSAISDQLEVTDKYFFFEASAMANQLYDKRETIRKNIMKGFKL